MRETAPRRKRERLQASLRRLGYEPVRQRGAHVRLTTRPGGEHHEVIPLHGPVRMKALSGILKNIARHHGIGVADAEKEVRLALREAVGRMAIPEKELGSAIHELFKPQG